MRTTGLHEILIGRYRLLRQIAVGGSSEVYAAEDTAVANRVIALKRIPDSAQPSALQALRTEFDILARFRHPHLPEAFDLHAIPGVSPAFVTMELIDGKDLLTTTSGWPVPAVLALVTQVCTVLDYLHRHGIVHRDVKADNILVEKAGDRPRAVLLDLSLAGPDGLALSAQLGGTPLYQAPETRSGQPGDSRSDLFSLGVLIYRLLTNTFPFPLNVQSEASNALDSHVPMYVVAPHLSPELCSVVERLLSKNPDHRYQHARELAQVLSPHVGDPSPGKRTLPSGRYWPLVGRRAELAAVREGIELLSPVNTRSLPKATRSHLFIAETATGKTRLLREIARACQLSGIGAFCADLSSPSCDGTTHPFISCLRTVVAWAKNLKASDARVGKVLDCHKSTVNQMVDRDAFAVTERCARDEEQHRWPRRELLEFLSDLSALRPFALLLDNVDGADGPTIQALKTLVGEDATTRFLIVLAKRNGGPEESIQTRTLMDSIERRIVVEPFTIDELASLISEIFPASDSVSELALQFDRLTAGHPPFIELVLTSLATDRRIRWFDGLPAIDAEDMADVSVPDAAARWTSGRIRQLSAVERRVLEALLVIEHPTRINTLRSMCGDEVGARGLEHVVAGLMADGTVRRDTHVATGFLSISHTLVSEAIAAQLATDRRRQLHDDYARILLADLESGLRPSPATLALHLNASGRSAQAAPWALEAAERATRRWEKDETCRLYRQAVEHLPPAAQEYRLKALQGLARAERRGGDYTDPETALTVSQRLVAEAKEYDNNEFVALGLAEIASVRLDQGRFDLAHEHVVRALRIARDTGKRDLKNSILAVHGDALLRRGRPAEAKRLFGRLVADFEREPPSHLCGETWYDLGLACHQLGDFDTATTCFANAAETFLRAGYVVSHINARGAIGATRLCGGDFLGAVRRLDAVRAETEGSATRRIRGLALANLGEARHRLGRFREGLADLRRAYGLLRHLGQRRYALSVDRFTAIVLIDQGDYTRAEEHLARARDGFMRSERQADLSVCLAIQGTIHRLVGDTTSARFWCERALEIVRTTKDAHFTAICLTHLARANLESHRGGEAIDQLVEARSLARGVGATDKAHLAARALARSLLELDRVDEVVPLLDGLLERAESASLAADIPEILFMRAACRARAGDFHQASRWHREALDRAAIACAAETRWEILTFAALLLAEENPEQAATMQAEADAWSAGCAAKLGNAARRESFNARLRARRQMIESFVLPALQAKRATASAADVPRNAAPGDKTKADLRDTGVRRQTAVVQPSADNARAIPPDIDGPVPRADSRETTPPTEPAASHDEPSDPSPGSADRLAGTGLLASRITDPTQQRRLRAALNLLLDRAVHLTRSDRGGLFLEPQRVPSGVQVDPSDEGAGALLPVALRNLERDSLLDAGDMSRSVLDAARESRRAVFSTELRSNPDWLARLTLRGREIPAILALPLGVAATPDEQDIDDDANPLGAHTTPLGVLYLDRATHSQGYDAADHRLAARLAAAVTRILQPVLGPVPDLTALDDLDARLDRLVPEVIATDGEMTRTDGTATFGTVTLIGTGAHMETVFDLTRRLADSSTPVLITGETGTGKELVARALHEAGHRRGEPFIAVDCGALSSTMAEAELFGHARGAFSGSERDRPGLLRAAGAGTLFLDEIGNLPDDLQRKLLRALETGEVRPVGEDRSFETPFRLLAATNADLDAAVRDGYFRADLLHRLKGGQIELPPLRTHMQDLEPMMAHLLAPLCNDAGRPVPELSSPLLARLHRHAWPGNVRELRMGLQTALAMNHADVLTLADFPGLVDAGRAAGHAAPPGNIKVGTRPTATGPTAGAPPRITALGDLQIPDALEGRMILRTLAHNEWDKTATAAQIGWSRQKLYRGMKKYGLPNRVTGDQIQAVQEVMQALSMPIDSPAAGSTRR
ncbi:MAG: sigma 54-interacting transcriptional regulator [Acidobacteriota bacterium]